MPLKRRQNRFGTLQRDLSWWKNALDYQLTRLPNLYLAVERYREWVNWDKRVYLSMVRPGNVVIDVGANVGAHAVFLSHVVRSKGRVLAFEPLASNLTELSKTLSRRSRINNIQIFPFAVGNPSSSPQQVSIKVPGSDRTQASLKRQRAGSWAKVASVTEEEVALTRLDAMQAVRSLPHLHFVKIDVEGGELDVLKGASVTLSRHRPLVYCELYSKWAASFGYTSEELFAFMHAHEYTGARVVSEGRPHAVSLQKVPPRELFETSSDVLFFAEQHLDLISKFDRRYLV